MLSHSTKGPLNLDVDGADGMVMIMTVIIMTMSRSFPKDNRRNWSGEVSQPATPKTCSRFTSLLDLVDFRYDHANIKESACRYSQSYIRFSLSRA